jgi:hypothetical protein
MIPSGQTPMEWLADHIRRYYPHFLRRGRRRRPRRERSIESHVQLGPSRQPELSLWRVD